MQQSSILQNYAKSLIRVIIKNSSEELIWSVLILGVNEASLNKNIPDTKLMLQGATGIW